jgi:hypothetical protein
MEASPNRIEVGRVINEAFDLYGRAFGALVGVAIVVFVVAGLLQGLLQEGGVLGWTLSIAVGLIATALYTGFVVRVVQDVRADGTRDVSVSDLLGSVGPAIAPLIGNSILRGIGIAIGFILLIVPGLFLLTIWSVTSPSIVVERQGAIDAFSRSQDLVRGHGWAVFGCILVAFLISAGVGILLTAVGAAVADVGGAIAGGIIAGVLTAPVAALIASILFFDLGGGEPAVQAEVTPAPVA